MLKSLTVAALAVTCVSAFQAPSAFLGNGLKAQVCVQYLLVINMSFYLQFSYWKFVSQCGCICCWVLQILHSTKVYKLISSFQAACRSSGLQMSAADEASTSRRAALGAILGGALAIPGIYPFLMIYIFHWLLQYFYWLTKSDSISASAFASYAGEKGRDSNWQLKDNGVMTGVVSSSMSGTRVSAFRQALIGNNEKAKTLPRNEISGAVIL
jgi:hypothetical protein